MNKKFIEKLETVIENIQKRLDKLDSWENLNEDERKDAIEDDTKLFTLEWVKNLYLECEE